MGQGPSGVGIQSVQVTNGNLRFIMSNGTTHGSWNIQGPQGRGIQDANVSSGNLSFTLTDGTNIGPWNIQGPVGETGTMGPIGETGTMGPRGLAGVDANVTWSTFTSTEKDDIINQLKRFQDFRGETGTMGPRGFTGNGIKSADFNNGI
jgi:hypothetical protein